ncbi:GlxA family transcriptional regulator [Pseudomonas sp. Marseille-Q5115]|uniref:GlxA family transcriptional regulator n=1 Tax=Pseudomonas sp. Marseille-Q5115 TaxID=2866593 RepID=UPI001CE432D7|nr:GlxA family transcriptional regulator [Pseudomonas sp. Marseille-Q5115]
MRKILIGILVFPGFQLLDIAGPRNAFGEVRVLGEHQYEIVTVGTTRTPLRSACGLTVVADRSIYEPCPFFDTLLVPGGMGVYDVYEDPRVAAWVGRQAKRCRRLAAACSGVFVLGGAGLLDQRKVTSHWSEAARLRAAFPQARVYAEPLRLKDGPVYTSAGASASMDLALLLIEEDFGRRFALKVAKYLLVYLQRPGGQAQFGPLLDRQAHGDAQVHAVRDYVIDRLQHPHTLASLAERVHMSPRNLTRLFSKQTGITPMAFVNDARIDAARELLETTDLPVSAVAERCGIDSADNLRRIFGKRLGLSPLEYRQRFQVMASQADLEAAPGPLPAPMMS